MHGVASLCLSTMLVVAIATPRGGGLGSGIVGVRSAARSPYASVMAQPRASMQRFRGVSHNELSLQAQQFSPSAHIPSPRFQRQPSLRNTNLRVNADESMKAGGFNTAGEAPFEIRGFSLGNAVLGVGSLILAASFSTFLKGDESGGSGIGFIYGVPIMLIGFALKYAELEPVPLISDTEAQNIFEVKASENLKKMKSDVTRHRYGDEAHMDTALKVLGLWTPGKAPPKLLRIKEQSQAGELAFTMYFEAGATPMEQWTDPLMKIRLEKFFGPGVTAKVDQLDEAGKELVTIQFRTGVEEDDSKPKNQAQQVQDGSVITVKLAEKPLGAVISDSDTLVKSVNAKAEGLGIQSGMRIQAINGYEVTKLNWFQAYKTFDCPMSIDFWVPEDLRVPVAKSTEAE